MALITSDCVPSRNASVAWVDHNHAAWIFGGENVVSARAEGALSSMPCPTLRAGCDRSICAC